MEREEAVPLSSSESSTSTVVSLQSLIKLTNVDIIHQMSS